MAALIPDHIAHFEINSRTSRERIEVVFPAVRDVFDLRLSNPSQSPWWLSHPIENGYQLISGRDAWDDVQGSINRRVLADI